MIKGINLKVVCLEEVNVTLIGVSIDMTYEQRAIEDSLVAGVVIVISPATSVAKKDTWKNIVEVDIQKIPISMVTKVMRQRHVRPMRSREGNP